MGEGRGGEPGPNSLEYSDREECQMLVEQETQSAEPADYLQALASVELCEQCEAGVRRLGGGLFQAV
jgi:hypothetical protein